MKYKSKLKNDTFALKCFCTFTIVLDPDSYFSIWIRLL